MHIVDHRPLLDILGDRELRECVRCGAKFVGWNWHVHCQDCYRQQSSPCFIDSPESEFDAELRQLQTELETTRLELEQERQAHQDAAARIVALEHACAALTAERDEWKRRHRALLTQLSPSKTAIHPVMLRRLISLCHPDRHHDSEIATFVTAWLLAQRRS